jgi:hypothetical protein
MDMTYKLDERKNYLLFFFFFFRILLATLRGVNSFQSLTMKLSIRGTPLTANDLLA